MVATLTPAATARPSRGTTQEWRFAARLARREVRRRPGRTLLVVLLIAVPVIAMTMASIWARTEATSYEESFVRDFGTAADASVWFESAPIAFTGSDVESVAPFDDPATIPDADDLRAALPAGSRVLEYGEAWVPLATERASTSNGAYFTDLPVTDPLAAGVVELRAGSGRRRRARSSFPRTWPMTSPFSSGRARRSAFPTRR